MSLADEMKAGFAAADDFAGDPFTMSNHKGVFHGVFMGDSSPTEFDKSQGYDTNTTNAVSISKSRFTKGAPPMVNEGITKYGEIYQITGVETTDDATWDLLLIKTDG